MRQRTLFRLVAALPLLVCVSCGSRAAGYGVILWGESEGAPRTGDVVDVLRESPVNSSYLIAVPGQTPREYPLGRLRVFKTKAEAGSFAASYGPSLTTWAVVTKQDDPPLPIRDGPAQDGKVVYKLAKNQLLKVVSRGAAQVTVKPYTDFWYEVVTEDGSAGWCFGHFLKVFTVVGDPAAEAQRIREQDDVLQKIMGTTWRPDWFADMAAKGALDLTMFREDVGLFPSPEENTIRLVLPLSSYEFHYTGKPEKQGVASYMFPGTDLRIDALDPDAGRINVTYRQKDQLVTRLYVSMTDDVAAIVASEQERRADLYAALRGKGATLASSAYGTIRLGSDMRFTWTGFGKLVPSIIPAGAKGAGAVDLTLRVGKEIAGDFDGAITFVFDEDPDAGVSFLYKAAAGGLRFTTLAKDSVDELFVTHPSLVPVVIFFSQSP